MIAETKKILVKKYDCPDCNLPMTFLFELNTDWYGELKYFKCKNCDETFVSRDKVM